MNLRPYSSSVLSLGGVLLMGLGLYFVFIRPALLPEDLLYMGATLGQVRTNLPGLWVWLPRVFAVMGGFMFSTGLLSIHLAQTSFRRREPGAPTIAAFAGAGSIGWMVVVNFLIRSQFKWLLLAFALPWAIAIVLYQMERKRR